MRKKKEKEAKTEVKTTNTQESLVTVIITAASIIAFIGGYVLSSGLTTKNFYSINYDNNDDEVVVSEGTLTKELSFNENNVYDRDFNLQYKITFPNYVINEDSYLSIEYGNSNYEIVVKKIVNEQITDEYKLEFDLKVNDIGLIREENKNAILYLLEDGSVEYTLIDDLLEKNFLRTNGRLNEATNVVKFISGSTCHKVSQECKNVIYAQSASGMLYDVNEMI